MPRWWLQTYLSPEIIRRWPEAYRESFDDFLLTKAHRGLSPECSRVTSVHIKAPEPDDPDNAVRILAFGDTE